MLSLGLSFPRPFDDNSHDGNNGEVKPVRARVFCPVSSWIRSRSSASERSQFGGEKIQLRGRGHGEKLEGIWGTGLGTCKEIFRLILLMIVAAIHV